MVATMRSARHVRQLVLAAAAFAAAAAAPTAARAQAGGDADDASAEAPRPDARDLVGSGMFLHGLQAAGPSDVAASATAFAGFDGARSTPVAEAAAEVRIVPRLTIHAGGTYVNDHDDRSSVRPSVSLRVNVLQQARTGVDLSLSGGWRQDRFDQDGGMLEAGVAVGRREGRLALVGNVALDSDLEGDDRDGAITAAALYRLSLPLNVGAQAFFRRDLGSSDLRRLMRNNSVFDFAVGPVASYALRDFAFTLQTGAVGLKGEAKSAFGMFALGGVGTRF
jgi:hypothetical protein